MLVGGRIETRRGLAERPVGIFRAFPAGHYSATPARHLPVPRRGTHLSPGEVLTCLPARRYSASRQALAKVDDDLEVREVPQNEVVLDLFHGDALGLDRLDQRQRLFGLIE